MGCIIEQYPNTKLWAKLLEIEADVLNIIHERLSCTQNSPSLAGTGETIRFSVSVIDNDTGPIQKDKLVAGTYDLIRIRSNIETTIVNDGTFSKRDGFIYVDIDFDTATWDLDDSYMLIPNQDSTAVIDGTTYYLPLAAWSGMILDLSGLETNVNTIITTLGTPAGASVSVDIADIEAKLDNGTYGLAALNADLDELLADVGNASGSGLGSLYSILGNPGQTFTVMVGYEGAASLASKLTLARAGYLDNINNAELLNIPDLSTLTAARIGYLDNINQVGLLQLTAARAGYFDNINNTNLATVPDISTLSAARIGYLDELGAANLPTDIDDIKAQKIEVNEVVIYPVSEHAGTTEISDDGTSPAYYADTESGTAIAEANPNVHWSEDINFENAGTITIISMYLEFEWEHKTSGGTAYSKIQISRDSGANWVDVTDSIAEANVAYQTKLREGVGNFIPTVVAGVNQLEFRLVSWEAGGATSSAKIRSNSYVRITYRKS